MKLIDRVKMGREAAQFGKIMLKRSDVVTIVCLPGHDAKIHSVVVRNLKTKIVVKCDIDTGMGFIPCKGNGSGICYHALGAITMFVDANDYNIAFSDRVYCANKIANMHQGSRVVWIENSRGNASVVATIWPKEEKDV